MESKRLTCFLSYSHAYGAAMQRVKQLLEVLDFQVIVFAGPDQRPPAEVVYSEIEKADLAVVLLGPEADNQGEPVDPANWPSEEAVFARAQKKPLAMIVHPGTRVPHLLEAHQTPARFDFWSGTAYADNAHHVVRQLIDIKRSFALSPGDLPYYYERVSFKLRVHRRDYIAFDVYHQVVARQPWSTFRHSVDTGPDRTRLASLQVQNKADVELAATIGSAGHELELVWGEATQHEQMYDVVVDPPIAVGGKIGYRRMFELDNFFPLTAAALRVRAEEPEFPAVFRQGSTLYYGTSFDVHSEMETLTATFEFPSNVDIRSCYAVAVVERVGRVNDQETSRITGGDFLAFSRSEETGESRIELNVIQPLAGHTYVLLYEPGK